MLIVFFVLVGFVALARLFELRVSARRRRALFAGGARPIPERGFGGMVALHVGILASSVVEVVWLRPAVSGWLSVTAALVVVGANALRIAAIRSLGGHWNVRVVDSTALGIVSSGPYRFVRHPNYTAVFLELSALPLVGGAWMTAMVGALLHAVVLARRVRLEESVLFADEGYRASMGEKPRFVPRFSRRTKLFERAEGL